MLAVFLMLLLGWSLHGGGKPVLATTLPASLGSGDAPGRISGQVTDPLGQPLAGIQVKLYPRYSGYPLRTTISAADGRYAFAVLAPAIYKVEFVDPSERYGFQFYPQAGSIRDATELAIAGNQLTQIDAQMVLAATISGAIQMLPGYTSSFGRITLYRPSASYYWEYYRQFDSTYPVSYRFSGLAAGLYHLCIDGFDGQHRDISECYNNQPLKVMDEFDEVRYVGGEESTDITITAATTTVIDFLLGDLAGGVPLNPGRITGTVRSLTGKGLPNIAVRADPVAAALTNDSLTVYTNEQGLYELAPLPAGNYQLYFSDADRIYAPQYYPDALTPQAAVTLTLRAGQLISAVNATLQIGAVITGNALVLDEAVLMNGSVIAYVDGTTLTNVGASTTIAPTGAYTLTGLAAGGYRICANGDLDVTQGFFSCYGGPDLDTASVVTVATARVYPDVNITLGSGQYEATISGVVTATDGPLPAIRVDLYEGSFNRWVYATTTDTQGRYQIQGLPNRTYMVRFIDPTGHYATTDYPSRKNPQPIEIHNGDHYTDVNVTLVAAGAIKGIISRQPGDPANRATVLAHHYTNGIWIFSDATMTDRNGAYTLQGLPPGEYYVESVRAAYPERVARFYGNVYFLADSPPITVVAGQVTDRINIIFDADRVYLPLINR